MRLKQRQSKHARGQAMVLFSLTLFLLALMVLMTLEIGQRVKDRMEAQVVADEVAYSEAVATARTFNAIALLNRAGMASYVSLLTTQSMISYAGELKGNSFLTAAIADLNKQMNNKKCVVTAPSTPFPVTQAAWEAGDFNAALQVKYAQGGAVNARVEGGFVRDNLVATLLKNSQLARNHARLAYPSGPRRGDLDAPTVPDASNFDLQSAIKAVQGTDYEEHLYALMGTRGDKFTTNRSGAAPSVNPGTSGLIFTNGNGGSGGGSGYGSPNNLMQGELGSPAMTSSAPLDSQKWCGGGGFGTCVNGTVAWAEDAGGTGTLSYFCAALNKTFSTPMGSGQAYVGSTDLRMKDDIHVYAGTIESDYGGAGATTGTVNGKQVSDVHTLGDTPPGEDGVVGGATGYNQNFVASLADLYGQPLMLPMIQRDYARGGVSDPWNLRFQFRFTSAGGKFDNGSAQGALASEAKGLVSMRYQVAMGSAIAYYHRKNGNQYDEPPNLFNPFWRATLVSGHISADAAREAGRVTPVSSVGNVLRSAGHTEAAQVADGLDLLNFRGY